MRTIAIINLKGGVAKTTSSINIAYILTTRGYKVLLVDNDKQGDCSRGLNRRTSDGDGIDRIMTDRHPDMQSLIRNTDYEGLDIITANLGLLTANMEVTMDRVRPQQNRLRKALQQVADRYDFCVVDNAPDINISVINALTAADSVIIPVQAQYLPAKGLEQLLRTITRVKRQLNPKLEVDGIVLTMVDSRTTLAREINALVRKTYGGHVFASEIPRSIKAAEISVENKSIYDHDRSGKAALAYENLTREVLSLGKQIKRHRTDPVR